MPRTTAPAPHDPQLFPLFGSSTSLDSPTPTGPRTHRQQGAALRGAGLVCRGLGYFAVMVPHSGQGAAIEMPPRAYPHLMHWPLRALNIPLVHRVPTQSKAISAAYMSVHRAKVAHIGRTGSAG